MVDLFSISSRGMSAVERALTTASHNIANANTEGYSRQRVLMTTSDPSFSGGMLVGTGVSVTSLDRVFDGYIENQLRVADAKHAQLSTFYTSATQFDFMLLDSSTSLNQAVDDYYNKVADLRLSPTSDVHRQAMLTEGQNLTNSFHTMHNQLSDMIASNNQAIVFTADEITTLASNIAESNQRIIDATTDSPDLLDQRDRLIRQLSAKIETTVYQQDDGSLNVFLDSGEPLVVGSIAMELEAVSSSEDNSRMELSLTVNQVSRRLDPQTDVGGQMGGLYDIRHDVIDAASRRVGRMALSLAEITNAQHRKGMDMTGNLGKDFFNNINNISAQRDRVIAHTNNQGDGTLSVSITDITQLTDDDYRLIYNQEGTFTLENLTTGARTKHDSLPIQVGGVSISQDGGTFSGRDSFLISPSRLAAKHMAMNISGPESIAGASPIRANGHFDNAGNAVITGGIITDIDHASFSTPGELSPSLKIEFLTKDTYKIVDATSGSDFLPGPFNYVNGISNPIFPASAIHQGVGVNMAAAGGLPSLTAGDLLLNGVTVSTAVNDGVSSSDPAGSAIAIAAAVNAGTATHSVTARVEATEVNLGIYTPSTITAGQFQINGQDVVAGATQDDLKNAINALESSTGVKAGYNEASELVLTAIDGRNIQVTTNGSSTTATLANFDLTGAADDRVIRAKVTLSSDAGDIVVGGTSPSDAGFTLGTYQSYDPGYRYAIEGNVEPGDSFTIEYNTDGFSDNSNIASIEDLKFDTRFGNGTMSVNELYTNLVIDVGNEVHRAEMNLETTDSLRAQAQSRRDSISGVNLDEETVTLMKLQQIYEANAKVIAYASDIFSTMLDSVR